jgi:hypothetical protein
VRGKVQGNSSDKPNDVMTDDRCTACTDDDERWYIWGFGRSERASREPVEPTSIGVCYM